MLPNFLVIFVFLGVSSCGLQSGHFSSLKSGAEYPSIVGNGYDSLQVESRQKACLSGKTVTAPSIQVIAQFNKVENWSWLIGQMNYSIPGAIYINPDSEMAKFVFRARDTYLSATYVLKQHVGVKKEYLTDPVYLPTYQELKKEAFREECGTHYLSVVERGGELHVGIKFSFASEEHKEEFEAGGAIKSMAGLGAHVGALNDDIRKNSSVEIFFNQMGGDISKLDSMFNSNDIIGCSLDNFKICENLIGDIWKYSTDGFAKSVLSGKDHAIGFKIEDYPNREKVYEDPVLSKERRKLLDELEKHFYDRDLLISLSARNVKLQNCDGRCIAGLSNKISSNIRALRDSIALSFADESRFEHYGHMDVLDLYTYEIPAQSPEELQKMRYRTHLIAAGLVAGLSLPLLLKLISKTPLPPN